MVIMVTTNYTFSKILRLLPSSVAYIHMCVCVCARVRVCVCLCILLANYYFCGK